MKIYFTVLFLGFQWIHLMAQNVMITNSNNPNEPCLMMDPKHPALLVAGTNLNGYHLSADTGRTWKSFSINSTYGVWGDPVIVADTTGAFYFFHLSNPTGGSWIDRIVCQKSVDSGKTWTDGTYTGLNGQKKQDKQWCVVDRKNNNLYMTWTQFDKYGSGSPNDSSIIQFSKSTDGGINWTSPMRISKIAGDCRDDDNTVEGATPAVGPNGEVYASWAGPSGLVFNRSLDQGKNWMLKESLIDSMPGGWNYKISGISRCNGLPVIACDLSEGPYRGSVYVNWSDQRNGSNNTDVWLRKSTDGGVTWQPRKKVNNDPGSNQQFFTWMAIDQSNGYLYFVFYDRRHLSGDLTDVYLAVSTDGGNTFLNQKISDSPFLPDSAIFFGDYTNIIAHNGIVRPVWTRLNSGKLSIWTHLINHDKLTGITTKTGATDYSTQFENFPNPSGEYVYVSYRLHSTSIVSLLLYDANGKRISTICGEQNKPIGKYVERVNLNELTIPPGIYYLYLIINGEIEKKRQLLVK